MNGIRNFLVCFWNNSIKLMQKIKSIIGILFPDKIMPVKIIKNKIGIMIFINLFKKFLKNKGIKKKVNKENLWINPPAISSSPKGPDNFLPVAGKPNISFP